MAQIRAKTKLKTETEGENNVYRNENLQINMLAWSDSMPSDNTVRKNCHQQGVINGDFSKA